MELANEILYKVKTRVESQILQSLEIAKIFLNKKVKYLYGSKDNDAIDCSGFIQSCYPFLIGNTEQQIDRVRDWLFTGNDMKYIEKGDVVFFVEKNSSKKVSHVGLISEIENNKPMIIHSSESQGRVVKNAFNIEVNEFREMYIGVGVAKIRPFLFRMFLNEEIRRRL